MAAACFFIKNLEIIGIIILILASHCHQIFVVTIAGLNAMEDPVPLKAFVGFLSNVLYLGFCRSVFCWIMGAVGLNQSLPIDPSRSCVDSALMRSVTTPLAELIPRHEVFWQNRMYLVCPQRPNFIAKVTGSLKGTCGLVKNSTYTQNFLKKEVFSLAEFLDD